MTKCWFGGGDRPVALAHVERGHFVERRIGGGRRQEMHAAVEGLAVDVDLLLAHFDGLAGQADDAR
jgi:hypothetical protein